MQFEQFDVLTKAFKSFVGKVYFFIFLTELIILFLFELQVLTNNVQKI